MKPKEGVPITIADLDQAQVQHMRNKYGMSDQAILEAAGRAYGKMTGEADAVIIPSRRGARMVRTQPKKRGTNKKKSRKA